MSYFFMFHCTRLYTQKCIFYLNFFFWRKFLIKKFLKILLGFSRLGEIELFCLTDFLCFLMTYADEWFDLTVQ